MGILGQFKNSYLQKSFSRLQDAITRMFSGGSIPSSDDVNSLVSIITSEMELARLSSEEFTLEVAKTLTKGIKLFAAKSESLVLNFQEKTTNSFLIFFKFKNRF